MEVNGIERRPPVESTYVSSLTAATIPQTSTGPTRPSLQKAQNSAEQERDRQADEFRQSVTIIFWFKPKADPIRLQQMIPTFPYFQFSKLGSLITDLGLSSNSYLDTYAPEHGHWEQHTINSVRVIKSQQRLLYRIRGPTLFSPGLSEDECVGLREEMLLQQASNTAQPFQALETPASHSLKRFASDSIESSQPNKIHVPSSYYAQMEPSGKPTNSSQQQQQQEQQQQQQQQQQQPANVSLPTPPTPAEVLPTSSSPDDSYMYRQQTHQNYYASPATTPATTMTSPYTAKEPTVPVHYPPHPPLKRWPNDYTVYELTVGFNEMDALIAQSPAGDNMTQRVAFERIFGLRYVKSTVCRHRAIWKKADRSLRAQFEALGTDQRACWGEFVRRVEGRPSAKAGGGVVTTASTSKSVYEGASALTSLFQHQNADEHQGEPVMDSLQMGGASQGGYHR